MQIVNKFMMAQTVQKTEGQTANALTDKAVRRTGVRDSGQKDQGFDRELSKAGEAAAVQSEPEKAPAAAAEEPVGEAVTQETAGRAADQKSADGTGDEGAALAEGMVTEPLKPETKQAADDTATQAAAAMLMAMAGPAVLLPSVQAEPVQPENQAVQEAMAGLVERVQEIPTSLEALLPQDEGAKQQADQNLQLMNLLQGAAPADPRMVAGEQETGKTGKAEMAGMAAVPEMNITEAKEPVIAVQAQPAEIKPLRSEEKDDDTRSNILEGIPFTVEDRTIPKTVQAQMSGDILQQQPQGGRKQTPMLTADGKQLQEAEQLPEEADFVRTRTSDAPQADNVQNAGANIQPASFSLEAADKAEPQTQPQPAAADYDIPKQIIDQAKLIRSAEDTQMIIKLKPEHLGELTLRISVTAGGAVNATFHSDNAQVRGIIEGSMVQLRQELQEQGLKVDNIDVRTGLADSFLMDSQAQQQQMYQQSQQSGTYNVRSERSSRDSFEADAVNTAAPAADTPVQKADADGVDYLV